MNLIKQVMQRSHNEKIVKNMRNSNQTVGHTRKNSLHVGMATRRDGNEFYYSMLISVKIIHPHLHTEAQRVLKFYSILISTGNGYNLILILIFFSLLLQYKF